MRGEPGIQRHQRFGPHAVQPPLRVDTALDQATVSKDPKVLRDRRLAETQLVDEFPHRTFRSGETVEDVTPLRLSQQIERSRRHRLNML